MKVQKTTNYSMFTLISENRKIEVKKVRALRKSIEKYGILRSIVVAQINGIIAILDGQHLFTALQLLGLPIFYTNVGEKSKEEAVSLMATLNSTASNWKLFDYCYAFAKLNNEDYRKVIYFFEKYNYGISDIGAVLNCSTGHEVVTRLKRGDFTSQLSIDQAEVIFGYIENILSVLPEVTRFQMSKVVRAFNRYYLFVEKYDHALIMKKVQQERETLRLFVEDKTFFEFFRDIKLKK